MVLGLLWGGLSYIEGVGGQIRENLQSFMEISIHIHIRIDNKYVGGMGAGWGLIYSNLML